MKIRRNTEEVFVPIEITLENQLEVDTIRLAFQRSKGFYCTDSEKQIIKHFLSMIEGTHKKDA